MIFSLFSIHHHMYLTYLKSHMKYEYQVVYISDTSRHESEYSAGILILYIPSLWQTMFYRKKAISIPPLAYKDMSTCTYTIIMSL